MQTDLAEEWICNSIFQRFLQPCINFHFRSSFTLLTHRRMRRSREAGEQLARLPLLDDPRPQVEGEHGRAVPLLLVQLVLLRLALAHRQRLGRVRLDLARRRLHVQEDDLLRHAVEVLSADDELPAVGHLKNIVHLVI